MDSVDSQISNDSVDSKIPNHEEIMETENIKIKKKPKKGIIYLSSIPPFMNVLRIREFFENFGKVGRVFLQPAEVEKGSKKKKKYAKHFTEGWVEFERKSVAKKVAAMLNNKQVSSRKNSKHYDYLWNIKYLSNFKWVHLNERLAYEKAVRRQKLRIEIEQAKKQATIFNLNLEKSAKSKKTTKLNVFSSKRKNENVNAEQAEVEDRGEFVKNLFGS